MEKQPGRGSGILAILCLLSLPLFVSCGVNRPPQELPRTVTPEERAQYLLVNLAWLNPRVAEPLVKGFSAAALDEAVGLVVMSGVEEAKWAEGLLQNQWWVSGDPNEGILGANGVEQVMAEVQRIQEEGEPSGEQSQKEIRRVLGNSGRGLGAPKAAGTITEAAEDTSRESPLSVAEERDRAELEDAVRWVQFMQAWSSYYQAAGLESPGKDGGGGISEMALDQAVAMSLLRPDFLDRLAALMAEGLGSLE